MDRNNYLVFIAFGDRAVALRKESVDRNCYPGNSEPGGNVALRKESVDRNYNATSNPANKLKSLSARRAWIEIVGGAITAYPVFRRSPQGERG